MFKVGFCLLIGAVQHMAKRGMEILLSVFKLGLGGMKGACDKGR